MSEPKQRTKSTFIRDVGIGVGIALIYTGFLVLASNDWNNGDVLPNITNILDKDYEVGRYECEGWIAEGNLIINSNHPEDNIENWNQKDRDRYVQLENAVLEHCIEKVDEITLNVSYCMSTYVIIQELREKMIEYDIGTLSEEGQQQYETSYKNWHSNGCESIKGEIIEMYENQT